MSSTIEATDENIRKKINFLKEIINLYTTCGLSINLKLVEELKTIEEEYEINSVNILCNYYTLLKNYKAGLLKKKIFKKQKEHFFKEYMFFFKRENFSSKIDRLYNIFKNQFNLFLKKNKHLFNKEILIYKKIIYNYENITINKNINHCDYNMCYNCENVMRFLTDLSKLECVKCGLTECIYGTIFEDKQFFFQEEKRNKPGSYDYMKHCNIWIKKIQASDNSNIPVEVINNVKNVVENIENVSCKVIREVLKQNRYSKYNSSAPLIRKLITGINPPQLTDEELYLIKIYFDKIIKIYQEIKYTSKINCFYFPYFLYKIIEHILKNGSKKRLHKILSCIHLQSRETLIKNDKIFSKICNQIEEFDYIPTDRNF